MTEYQEFLRGKSQIGTYSGFEPIFMPSQLMPFQASLVDWAMRKGKCLLLEDCGMGKTFQYLVWAQNIVQKENSRVLIVTPLAVSGFNGG